MKIDNGKIVEATTMELYKRYLQEDYDSFMTFMEYMWRMENSGCKIVEEKGCGNTKTAMST